MKRRRKEEKNLPFGLSLPPTLVDCCVSILIVSAAKSFNDRPNWDGRSRVLGEEKYGPGSEPQWKAGGARYPNLYKALLEEPSRTLRTKLLEDIPSGKTGDGRNTRRPARARIRNQ